MGHPRRWYPAGTTYLITNRTAEGLPFVACLYINLMLFGILARAAFRSPSIKICAWLFLSNHYHGLVVLNGTPDDLKNFMNYIDGEIAKLVVRWRGTRNVNVWAQRYNAVPILTWDSVIEKLVYIFINPVDACFVDKSEDWYGCSTFYAFKENAPREYKWIRPRHASKLPNASFSKKLCAKLVSKIATFKVVTYALPIQPFAWIDCFPDAKKRGEEEIRSLFFKELAHAEAEKRQMRAAKKESIAPRTNVEEQNFHKAYKPKNFGRRVICISSCPELRADFIALYRAFCESASRAYRRATETFTPIKIPPGGFAPPQKCRGSLLPVFQLF